MNFDALNDDGKLHQRYYNKRVNALKESIEFNLSLDEFCELMTRADIKSSQLGIKQYHLSRYNDIGDYSIANCRFTWYLENYAEKKVSDKSRVASINNLIKAKANITSDDLSGFLRRSEKFTEYIKKRKEAADEHNRILDSQKHPSYKGVNNSQHGSYWITNGECNKKWRDELGSIPDGFSRGRKTK